MNKDMSKVGEPLSDELSSTDERYVRVGGEEFRLVREDPPDRSARAWKYPFALMAVGESVSIDMIDARTLRKAQTVVHVTGKSKGWKFVTRAHGLTLKVFRVA